jgi:hypothetical protein
VARAGEGGSACDSPAVVTMIAMVPVTVLNASRARARE